MIDTAVFTHRRGGTVVWDKLSHSDQVRLNRNRRAMGLQPRGITATWDISDIEEGLYGVSLVDQGLVGSSERTEEADVSIGFGA